MKLVRATVVCSCAALMFACEGPKRLEVVRRWEGCESVPIVQLAACHAQLLEGTWVVKNERSNGTYHYFSDYVGYTLTITKGEVVSNHPRWSGQKKLVVEKPGLSQVVSFNQAPGAKGWSERALVDLHRGLQLCFPLDATFRSDQLGGFVCGAQDELVELQRGTQAQLFNLPTRSTP